MRRILLTLVLAVTVSCATMPVETKQSVDKAVYYARYITGLKDYLPWLAVTFPKASPAINEIIVPLLTAADVALADYQAGKTGPADIQAILTQINHVVGEIRGAS